MTSIYIISDLPLPGDRYDLEDDLQDFLGEDGMVSGGGSVLNGDSWNIDLEVETPVTENIIQRLIPFLKERNVGTDTYLNVYPPDWEEGDEPRRVDVFPAAE